MGVLETVIAAILISLFIVIFFGRILSISATIEREAMQQTVNHISSALNIEALTLYVKGDQKRLARWEGANPIKLLSPLPLQYRGSLTEAEAIQVAPGSWFFDEDAGLLIYRINHIDQFSGGRAIPERVRFRVEATFDDSNGNLLRDENEKITGLKLNALDNYSWHVSEQENTN